MVRIILLSFVLSTALQLKRPHHKSFDDIVLDIAPGVDAMTREALVKKIDEGIRSGFPLALRSPEPLAGGVARLKAGGYTDPCEADFLMDGLAVEYGFGARAMAIVDEMQIAVLLNKSVSICDGDTSAPGIDWLQYFANTGFGVCNDKKVCYAKKISAGMPGAEMSIALRKQSVRNALPLTGMKQFLYRQFFTFNQRTRGIVAQTLRQAGLTDGLGYVGVHIRRGDKVALKNLPIALWAEAAAEALERRSLSTVFVASDDERAGGEFCQALAALHSVAGRPAPIVIQLYSNSSSSRTYADPAGLMAVLTDVAALRDSQVYISSHKSYLGRLVYFLRHPEAESTSLTGDWLEGSLL